MKLNITRELLLTELQKIVNVIEKRQTMPILSNVLINAEENELVLTGSDLEIQIITRIDIKPDIPGVVTIPAKKFLDICRLLPESATLNLELKNDKVKIVSGSARFLLNTLSADLYPEFLESHYEHSISLQAGKFKQALDKTLFCMANQDVRYYLNGLFINISNSRIKLVASDGHRLSIYEDDLELESGEEARFIMPRKAVQELSRLLDDSEQPIDIDFSDNNIRLTYGNMIFSTKLVDAKYPDFQHIFEQDFYSPISVKKNLLKDALTRVSVLSHEKIKGITCDIIAGNLTISAHNQERDEAEEELEIDYSDDSFSISFNSQYLLDAISNLDSEDAHIFVASNLSTCFIIETDQTLFKFIVMPMKL